MSELDAYKKRQHRIFGEFLHEIKTPLAIMRSHLESEIINELLPLATRTKLVQDVEEISRMNLLINDVKFLLDDESSEKQAEFTQESLLEVVMDVVEMLEPMAEEKEQTLSLVCSENYQMNMDKNRLIQLFVNLISNGIKYSDIGGKISLHVSHDSEHIYVDVNDNGRGIESKECEAIFEAFYRVRNSNEEGSGLGLALCSAIVQRHNAKIELTSKVGSGSNFRVIFEVGV